MTYLFLLPLALLLSPSFGGITTVNPFLGVDFFVNPDFVASVGSAAALYPSQHTLVERASVYSVAYWVDRISKVQNVTQVLNNAKAQQLRTGNKVLAVIVVYDLPNRDCAASSSNGEISCADSDCVQGLVTYKTMYIDPLVAIFGQFPGLTIVTLVEPDSLPNLATNLGVAKCTQAATAYKQGIAYAVQQLATLPNVAIYLDSAHGGWLGYSANLPKIASVFSEVLTLAGGQDKIRGFATNTANYQPLGSITSTNDPCGLKVLGNVGFDEVHFVSALDAVLQSSGITNKGYIIDTGRNGVPNARTNCANWCNIKGAGLGVRPSSNTAFSGISMLDAVYWSKVPGESDGTSNSTTLRYDAHCSSVDSTTPAPQAGQWFPSYFLALCQNAQPSLLNLAAISNAPTSNEQPSSGQQLSSGQLSGATVSQQTAVTGGSSIIIGCVWMCFVGLVLC